VARRFWRGTGLACSGTEFLQAGDHGDEESFSRLGWWRNWKERLPGFDQHLKAARYRMPEQLADRHWIADIGIDGKKIKVRRTPLLMSYYFCPWRKRSVCIRPTARAPVGYRCPATEVSGMRSRDCLRQYLTVRQPDQNLASVLLRGIQTRSCGSFWRANRWKR